MGLQSHRCAHSQAQELARVASCLQTIAHRCVAACRRNAPRVLHLGLINMLGLSDSSNPGSWLQGAVAPMFPDPEAPLPQDEFGEATDLVALCGTHYHGDEDLEADSLPAGDDLQARHLQTFVLFTCCGKVALRRSGSTAHQAGHYQAAYIFLRGHAAGCKQADAGGRMHAGES
jgi:hypothetical protein